ncbi:MAG: stage II sporulation protein P [Acidobacteriota bacterium]
MTYKKNYILFLTVIASIVLIITIYNNKANNIRLFPSKTVQWEAPGGHYYSLVDQNGQIILQTGLKVNPGDEFIDHHNMHYRVTSISGWNCSTEAIEDVPAINTSSIVNWIGDHPALAETTPHVALYHTHSDESYTPTQGVPSQPGHGSIFQVGSALTDSLSKSGITVYHDFTPHDPHDTHAYMRSRRTAFRLLKLNPTALFDIHRDSAPPEPYITYITGIESAKVMIVVGRQNPRMAANIAFARQIKDKADGIYPDLIRGIFIGQGNYNQDLGPRALLFEIGTERLPEQMALDAARCLGDVISSILK